MKTILITGASGFIGQNLCLKFLKLGFKVVAVCRTHPEVRDVIHYPARLGDSLEKIVQAHPPDLVIHGANSTSTNQYRDNVDGTIKWVKEIENYSDARQIYLGSVSGHASNTGEYGRAKFEVENLLRGGNHIVLKLGLVVGHGGFVLKLAEMTRYKKWIPLLDGGSSMVHWSELESVVDQIAELSNPKEFDRYRGQVLNWFSNEQVTLKSLMQSLAHHFGSKPVFFPIPSAFLYACAKTLEALRFKKLPFSSASILSSRQNKLLQLNSSIPQSQQSQLMSAIAQNFDQEFNLFWQIHTTLFKDISFSEELFLDYKNALTQYGAVPLPQKYLPIKNQKRAMEGIEFSLRRESPVNALSQRFHTLTFLCESRCRYFSEFISEKRDTMLSFFILAFETVRSLALLIYGKTLRNRHGL